MACGFSILAITAARPRAIFLASAISSGRCTKDSAIQSAPASSAASRSEWSLPVRAENPSSVLGTLTPLRAESLPPTSTRVTARFGEASSTESLILPSSSSSVWPGLRAVRISGCGRWTRVGVPRRRIGIEDEVGARRKRDGIVLECADAQLRSLQVDKRGDRPAVLLLDVPDDGAPARASDRAWYGSC